MFWATPPFWPTATVACCAGRRCIAMGIAYYVVVSSILPELQATTTIGYRGEGSAVQFGSRIWKKFDRILFLIQSSGTSS